MLEIWAESARFKITSKKFADKVGIIFKKYCYSDIRILEI